jgi:hypothetical protein
MQLETAVIWRVSFVRRPRESQPVKYEAPSPFWESWQQSLRFFSNRSASECSQSHVSHPTQLQNRIVPLGAFDCSIGCLSRATMTDIIVKRRYFHSETVLQELHMAIKFVLSL